MSSDHILLCTISNICMLRKNTAQRWLRVKDLFWLTLHVPYTSPYTIWPWWQSITFRVKWLWNTMNSDANSFLVDGTWHVEYLLSHIVTPQNCVGRIRYNSSKNLNLKYLLIRLFFCESYISYNKHQLKWFLFKYLFDYIFKLKHL
jgi:hypothetical protein